MIYVSQGHERGIGLEVFIKAFLSISNKNQSEYLLVVMKNSLEINLKKMGLTYFIDANSCSINGICLNCFFINESSQSETLQSLNYILKMIKSDDILLTLPSSKDQFRSDNINYSGHTEYFRSFFKQANLTMCFLSFNSNFLLLTDHIDIKNVSNLIDSNIIDLKIKNFLNSNLPNRKIKEIYFSGINPHCGESGQISNDDYIIEDSIKILMLKYPKIKFHSMMAGDTLHFNIKSREQLFVYSSHDQGLGVFKQRYGLTGINYTAGLNFKRVSVDHGTAFDLYGKNEANYTGMLYLLHEINSW